MNISTDSSKPDTTALLVVPTSGERDRLTNPRSRRITVRRMSSRRGVRSLESLWIGYARLRDDRTRNLLVERYQPLVASVVRHFAQRLPRNVDRGDLATAANFGLMAAIEGFDPTRGVPFESYCELRVKGALLDELRNQDWLPRPWRTRLELQKRTVERLRATFAREPGEHEIAAAMELSIEEYREFFGFGRPEAPTGSMSADLRDEDDGLPGLDIVADEGSSPAEEKLTREEILCLVAEQLTVQEYRLVYLKYWEELSLREIGAMMQLSESRVCKIHIKLLERLKERLGVDALA